MSDAVERLKTHLATIVDLRAAAAVLGWDQETYMPPGGAVGRAEQLGTLNRIAHEMFTSASMGDLLAAAEAELSGLDPDSDEAALIRMTRRDYDRARKLPPDFVAERARARSLSTQVWQQARQDNDFTSFWPYLRQMFDFARRTADYLGYRDHPYDALLDQYEPEMTSAAVAALFSTLRDATVPLVRAIAERGRPVEAGFLTAEYDEGKQRQFGLAVAADFGYDLGCGRLDRSAHPFSSGFGRGDVRITT
ncbi:MAG: carboxypeptidase M32, partial [Armatimonadetes bacterium]|nr:carboxypeptidase M32 [Armatimonadota bacterium]